MTVSYPLNATGQFSLPVQLVDDTGLPIDPNTVLPVDPDNDNPVTINWRGFGSVTESFSLTERIANADPWQSGGWKKMGNPDGGSQVTGMLMLCLPDEMFETSGPVRIWYEQEGVHLICEAIEVGRPTADEIADEVASRGLTYEFQSPVISDAEIDIARGGDYYTADGRDLEWSFERPYTPTSCKLTISSGQTITITSTDITESSGSGSGRFSVRFQIPRETGDDLESGTGTFEVLSILSNGHEIPEIAEGKATIRRRLTP